MLPHIGSHSSDSENISQINLLQGKSKNLLKTIILVYAFFINALKKTIFE